MKTNIFSKSLPIIDNKELQHELHELLWVDRPLFTELVIEISYTYHPTVPGTFYDPPEESTLEVNKVVVEKILTNRGYFIPDQWENLSIVELLENSNLNGEIIKACYENLKQLDKLDNQFMIERTIDSL